MSRNVRVAGSLHEGGENIGLHRFALFTACCTAFLTFVGGLVASIQAGLSFPDRLLSAFTISTENFPLITTARVGTGALILGTFCLWTLREVGMVQREVAWQ